MPTMRGRPTAWQSPPPTWPPRAARWCRKWSTRWARSTNRRRNRRHHRRHRRHRLPDQYPGPERRSRSRARRRTGARICRGRGRSAQPGAAFGQRSQGNQGPDRRFGRKGRGRQPLVDQAGARWTKSCDSVKQVTDMIAKSPPPARAIGGIDQINQAIIQMDQVTQQNAALVEEAAAAAPACRIRPELLQLVSVFKIDGARRVRVRRRCVAGKRPTPCADTINRALRRIGHAVWRDSHEKHSTAGWRFAACRYARRRAR